MRPVLFDSISLDCTHQDGSRDDYSEADAFGCLCERRWHRPVRDELMSNDDDTGDAGSNAEREQDPLSTLAIHRNRGRQERNGRQQQIRAERNNTCCPIEADAAGNWFVQRS